MFHQSGSQIKHMQRELWPSLTKLLRVRLYSSAMEESNLSKPNVLPQPQTDRFLPLPPELMLFIIQLLSHKDQQTFCLLLSAVFRKLVYSRNVGLTLRGSTRRGEMLKQPSSSSDNSYQPFCYDIDPWLLVHLPWIRELALHDRSYGDCDYESILFPYLRSLPNLQSFTFSHFHRSPGFLQLSPPYRTALLSTSHIGLNFPLFQRNA